MENFILELAKVTIPGLLVLLTTYYLLRDFFKNEERKRYYEMRRETAKSLNPIKLTAYERLALFLERIRPDSLIMRVQTGNMTSGDLHLMLLTTIREEFEHNVTQQIYVGKEVWCCSIARQTTGERRNLVILRRDAIYERENML